MRTDRLLNALRHPFTEYQVSKAKREYRKTHQCCEMCSSKRDLVSGRKCDVHHRVPVHIAPELATHQSNLITFCRTHHFWIGHGGSWKTYNANLWPTITMVLGAYQESLKLRDKNGEV